MNEKINKNSVSISISATRHTFLYRKVFNLHSAVLLRFCIETCHTKILLTIKNTTNRITSIFSIMWFWGVLTLKDSFPTANEQI